MYSFKFKVQPGLYFINGKGFLKYEMNWTIKLPELRDSEFNIPDQPKSALRWNVSLLHTERLVIVTSLYYSKKRVQWDNNYIEAFNLKKSQTSEDIIDLFFKDFHSRLF